MFGLFSVKLVVCIKCLHINITCIYTYIYSYMHIHTCQQLNWSPQKKMKWNLKLDFSFIKFSHYYSASLMFVVDNNNQTSYTKAGNTCINVNALSSNSMAVYTPD